MLVIGLLNSLFSRVRFLSVLPKLTAVLFVRVALTLMSFGIIRERKEELRDILVLQAELDKNG